MLNIAQKKSVHGYIEPYTSSHNLIHGPLFVFRSGTNTLTFRRKWMRLFRAECRRKKSHTNTHTRDMLTIYAITHERTHKHPRWRKIVKCTEIPKNDDDGGSSSAPQKPKTTGQSGQRRANFVPTSAHTHSHARRAHVKFNNHVSIDSNSAGCVCCEPANENPT